MGISNVNCSHALSLYLPLYHSLLSVQAVLHPQPCHLLLLPLLFSSSPFFLPLSPQLRIACRHLCNPFFALANLLCIPQMFQTLYGQTAAALYAKAAGQNAQARQLYNASADTYYKANDAAAYDDWVRARNHWDYFYNRS